MFAPKYSHKSTLGCMTCYDTTGESGLGDAISKEYGGQNIIGGMITSIPFIGGLFKKIPLIGGMFKKATHMESCMKWWTDSNIRSMMGPPTPLQTPGVYYSSDSAKMQADKIAIDKATNIGLRQERVKDLYLQIVRSQPDVEDLFMMQCASMPKGQAETHAGINPAEVVVIWEALKQAARDAEYQEAYEKVNAIVEARKLELIQTKRAESTYFATPTATGLPVGVQSITSGGSLVVNVGPPKISKTFPIIPVKK